VFRVARTGSWRDWSSRIRCLEFILTPSTSVWSHCDGSFPGKMAYSGRTCATTYRYCQLSAKADFALGFWKGTFRRNHVRQNERCRSQPQFSPCARVLSQPVNGVSNIYAHPPLRMFHCYTQLGLSIIATLRSLLALLSRWISKQQHFRDHLVYKDMARSIASAHVYSR